MMTFVRMESRGLVILPTHRVVQGLPTYDREKMLESAKAFFNIARIDLRSESRSATTLLEEAGEDGTGFVAVTRQGPSLSRANRRLMQDARGEVSTPQRGLDVLQLHKIL